MRGFVSLSEETFNLDVFSEFSIKEENSTEDTSGYTSSQREMPKRALVFDLIICDCRRVCLESNNSFASRSSLSNASVFGLYFESAPRMA